MTFSEVFHDFNTEWRDKESPLKTTEYTVEELKTEYPLVDPVQFFNLRQIEELGRTTLSNNQTHHVQVRKYHYKANAKDPTDVALADYINDKFSREVPPNVSLPNPISRLGQGKYLFEDRVVNVKLTNGAILGFQEQIMWIPKFLLGGGWMRLREVLVRLSAMAACAALRDRRSSMVKTNISEWKETVNRKPPPSSPQPQKPTSPSSTKSPTPQKSQANKATKSTSPTPIKPTSPVPSPTSPPPQKPASPSSSAPPPSPKKPFPKIPPLKLPSKSSKPILSAKPPALSLFPATASTPPQKKRSLSLPRSLTPETKLKIAAQLSLPSLPTKLTSSAPHTLALPPPASPVVRVPLPLSRSASLNAVTTPRGPDSSPQASTPRRTPSSESIENYPRTPRTPKETKDSKYSSQPATPRVDPATPPSSSPSAATTPPESPFRSPRISLSAPKLATLKGKT